MLAHMKGGCFSNNVANKLQCGTPTNDNLLTKLLNWLGEIKFEDEKWKFTPWMPFISMQNDTLVVVTDRGKLQLHDMN